MKTCKPAPMLVGQWSLLLSLAIMTPSLALSVQAETVEAFMEPYRRVAVPASEVGVIDSLFVEEGDVVVAKQVLGNLDDAVLRSSLEVAMAAMNSTGPQLMAEAEYVMRLQQVEGYRTLQNNGNATPRELAQAEMELQQSLARLQSVREDLEVRRLEYERVKQQIQQRKIIAPIDGVIVAIDKHVGEFVAPTEPTVLHLVQLDALRAVFSVPRSESAKWRPGDPVTLTIGSREGTAIGLVEFVSPIANPESNTVQVKVRIPNSDGKFSSGVSCRWELGGSSSIADETRVSGNGPVRKR